MLVAVLAAIGAGQMVEASHRLQAAVSASPLAPR
jgi:hypothetical protein